MSDLFRNFHVLEIRAGYEDELTRLTRPDGWDEPGPTLSDGDNRAPFTAILAHARGLGCKSIVIEDDYVDTNYSDEHQAYYSRVFRPIPNKCHRLHFFGTKIQPKDIEELHCADRGYLGFSVLRPIDTQRIGRTCLSGPRMAAGSVERHVTAWTSHEAHVGGAPLRVDAMPFIQQDKNVSVCAHAALWMTAALLHRHRAFGIQNHRPSAINVLATRHLPMGTLREGLYPIQIQQALQGMGVEALRYVVGDGTNEDGRGSAASDLRILGAYVLSGIPVVLGIDVPGRGGHAITVIGHSFDFTKQIDRPASLLNWMTDLIVHDDAKGPYQSFPLGPKPGVSSFRDGARAFIVPIPPRVTMRAENVLMHAATLVHEGKINDILRDVLPPSERSRGRVPDALLRNLVLSPYLIESNDFKREILESDMDPGIALNLRSLLLPKHVWIVELTTPELLAGAAAAERKVVGEIVFDSTADWRANTRSFLAIHLDGRLLTRRPELYLPDRFCSVEGGEPPYRSLLWQRLSRKRPTPIS